jgi:hypothetical protein
VDATIYGSSDIAPLVALKSGRSIHSNFIDTNMKTFITGMFNVSERTEKLKGVDFLVMAGSFASDGSIVTEEITTRDFINRCRLLKRYDIIDYNNEFVLLYDCR